MAEGEAAAKQPEDILRLEKAVSNRSTCRTTGEKIQKDEWRIGIEAWRGGRMSLTWQKALPFLENCFLEECSKGNSGTCKLTGHKFAKGETRFVFSTGEKKIFLTIPATAKVIKPVTEAEGVDFDPADFKGVGDIPEADKAAFLKEFGVSGESKRAAGKKKPGSKEKKPKEEDPEKEEAKAEEAEEDDEQQLKVEEKPKLAARRSSARGKRGREAADAAEKKQKAGSQKEDAEDQGQEAAEDEVMEEDADGEPEPVQSPGLPEYEQQRLQIIARNRQRMQELGLQQLAAEIMPPDAQPKPRSQNKGLAAKRKAAESAGPRRASLRQKGVSADGRMIDQELRNGQVVLSTNGYSGPWNVAEPQAAPEPEQPKERHPQGPLLFESKNGDEDIDSRFLELLRRVSAPTASTSKGERGAVQLHKLRLREADVAKVCDNGISHIQWHPSSERLIVAAADKSGNLGLWDVDHDSTIARENGALDDGVLSFKPHYSYVSGLRWAGGGGGSARLFTASYDGSLSMLDPCAGRFERLISSDEAEFSSFDCSPDANVTILGDNDGYLHVFDVREGQASARGKPAEIHNKRVNTLHFCPRDDHLFVSSSSDNSLAVWDLRKLDSGGKFRSLAAAVHPKTCQSAYFAPDGSRRVASLSRDDTVKVWQFDGKASLRPQAVIRHNNNTGRWILPFRATWSPSGDAIIVGNMKRQVDIYSAAGEQLGALDSEFMTAISSRAAVHPERGVLCASTASGRVHIYR